MEHQHTEKDLKDIARQLACPEGEHGIKTGEMMHASNIGMTSAAIDALNLQNDAIILEIGHGNGAHIENLLKQANDIQYFGADISETMIAAAKRINSAYIESGQVSFQHTNGQTLPYADASFDGTFTVNTIYFWQNPNAYLLEIKRVLKPGGKLVLCFADKTFMEKLPFTPYGFTLYGLEKVQQLLAESGFTIKNTTKNLEQVLSKTGEQVEREYYVVVASV
ncbi:class I SAM-dependent methyltransferase [Pedobacter soli]|uniref:Methyltransferase domain-containing protein n=1 Tax=Pedobacter soli TaxID=390242 RepID=A0A1G6QFA4_9SPHI|nr:class I SAM-dependent methyltransferase [Pedobacter soli]SDC91150.1 Methyltransferase domain-containing protein [Pedobacter soli]